MKRFTTPLVLLGALTLAIGAVSASEEQAWFDLKNCEMCVSMSSEEGLMENMTCEHHLIGSGFMTITTVNPDYTEAFNRSMDKMKEMGAKLAKGEKANLCGYCVSHGSLMMAGAKIENLETGVGYIMLATSSDPKLVEKIHAHGQRTIDEYATMLKLQKEDSHEGHDHD